MQLQRRRPGLPRRARLGGRAGLPGRLAARPPPARPAAARRRSPRRLAGWPRDGVEVNEQQAYLLRILEPILTRTPEAAAHRRARRPAARRGRPPRQPRPGRLPRRARRARVRRRRRWPRPIGDAMARRRRAADRRRPRPATQVVERAPLAVRVARPSPAHQPAAVVRRRAGRARAPRARGSDRAGRPRRVARRTPSPSPRRWSPPTRCAAAGTVGGELARRRATGGTTHVSVATPRATSPA